MTRRSGWIVAVGVLLLALAAVGALLALGQGSPAGAPASGPPSSAAAATGPHALTTEEAERLAVARFLAYQDGSREFRTAVSSNDVTVTLHGRVDYRAKLGIAAVATGAESAVITWNGSTFVGWDQAGDGDAVPPVLPAEPGGARPLDPTASAVDTVLALLLGLGIDRPDNAQLLQQSDAAWLRVDDVAGTPVDVFSGPSPAGSEGLGGSTRFWVDSRGQLLRFEADLPSGTVMIDLLREEYSALPASPQF